MNHFKKELNKTIADMDSKFKGMYNYEFNTEEMCIFKLYWRIEKRGFRVYEDGIRIWQNQIRFSIERKMS